VVQKKNGKANWIEITIIFAENLEMITFATELKSKHG